MEVIIAVFEMQMRHCILRWKRSALGLDVFMCVCVGCVCVFVAYNDSSLLLTLSYCSCLHRWWEKLTLRWNGHPNWRLEPNQRKVTNSWHLIHIISVFCTFPVAPFCSRKLIYHSPQCTQMYSVKTELFFPCRSTCEGGREENQCFGSQKEDTRSAGNQGEGSAVWFSQFVETVTSTMYRWKLLLPFKISFY